MPATSSKTGSIRAPARVARSVSTVAAEQRLGGRRALIERGGAHGASRGGRCSGAPAAGPLRPASSASGGGSRPTGP